MCIVDTGARNPIASCSLPVSNGMNVRTNTPATREARRNTLELNLPKAQPVVPEARRIAIE